MAFCPLKGKVEERTAQLKQANEQLQREIIERRRAGEEVRFLQKMTQAISEAVDFHAALGVVLQQVCEVTGWGFGEAWIPNPSKKVLMYSPAWYGSIQSLDNFRKTSEELIFSPATGLPGRVWLSKQPEWIEDLSKLSAGFIRSELAIAAGFKAGLGIPIVAHTSQNEEPEVLAVLVFFMFESCEEDKRQIEIVSTVVTQLGSLILLCHSGESKTRFNS